MDPRTTRAGGRERRNHAPPGRLRRIFFDHRGATAALVGGVVVFAALFVATSAWAVNERFKRDVTRIAYSHDARSLRFLAEQEAKTLARVEGEVGETDPLTEAVTSASTPYLVVSIEERRVALLRGQDTLFSAPVAVGSGNTLVLGGETKRFQTPRGKMEITAKELDPIWVPPSWHYVEVARKQGLEVVGGHEQRLPRCARRFPCG